MAVRIVTWSPERAKAEISKRYRNARDARRPLEDHWQHTERTLFSNSGAGATSGFTSVSDEPSFSLGLEGVNTTNSDVNVSYAFKNLRFIHAQMSANPPSVVMRPTSSDQEDRRAADGADRICRYALRQYKLPEKVDQLSLQALTYGTGVIKVVYDSTKGDVLEVNQETGEMLLEGDISIYTPHMWNLFLDPDAQCPDEVKWAIERIYLDYDEACARWPEKEDLLKQCMVQRDTVHDGKTSELQRERYNCVELLEYWETGLPTNGYLGRYTITTPDGDEIEPVRPSPHRFTRAGAARRIARSESLSDQAKEFQISKLPQIAKLPYHILTDVDVPNQVMGKSFIDYVAPLQDTLNRLDTATLDNIQAHGVARLVIPETAGIADDSITDSPLDVIKITGSQPPHFLEVPQLMPEMSGMRTYLTTGINDMSGVNESMFGQQSREQSGASMQYATNQGNMIRRRLFNKYVLVVESIYKDILNLVRKHWTTSRTIYVLGKEKALEALDIKGMDIDGGYDVIGEYGVSLSLDPMTRREEIMALQPLFEKAGIPTRLSLKMLKLNELEGMYDILQLAEDRQREYFEEMISTGRYVSPERFQDHENMIAYALLYFMTSDFKYLEQDRKELCWRHIEERAQLAAQDKAGSPPQAPGPAPLPGEPPVLAGATGEQAAVDQLLPMSPG